MALIFRKFSLLTIWCSSLCLLRNADAQGFLYKNKDITQYEIRNGKYKIVTTTTPPPSLLETFFPWAGNSYNSVRTPEEDAALIDSLSDPPNSSSQSSSSDGFMSWLPSIPGFGGSSAPPSTGAAGNSIFGGPPPPPQGYPYPGAPPPPPQGPYPGPVPMNYNGPPPPQMMEAASMNQPIYVAPPGQENQLGGPPGSFEQYPPFMDYPQGMMDYPPPGQQIRDYPPPGQPMMDYPPPPFGFSFNDYPPPEHMSMPPPPPPSSQQIPNDFEPTFQFHQQIKDSLPLPNPSIPGFGQPQFPFPFTSGANLLNSVKNVTVEKKPESYFEMIAKYLTFGKRSDLPLVDAQIQERSDSEDISSTLELENEEVQKLATELISKISKDQKDADSFDKMKEVQDSSDGKHIPCPKGGIWRWNGEVCIAVGPVPIWACKPNDMVVSGKLAICKNKIYFSPKVINTMHRDNDEDSDEKFI